MPPRTKKSIRGKWGDIDRDQVWPFMRDAARLAAEAEGTTRARKAPAAAAPKAKRGPKAGGRRGGGGGFDSSDVDSGDEAVMANAKEDIIPSVLAANLSGVGCSREMAEI